MLPGWPQDSLGCSPGSSPVVLSGCPRDASRMLPKDAPDAPREASRDAPVLVPGSVPGSTEICFSVVIFPSMHKFVLSLQILPAGQKFAYSVHNYQQFSVKTLPAVQQLVFSVHLFRHCRIFVCQHYSGSADMCFLSTHSPGRAKMLLRRQYSICPSRENLSRQYICFSWCKFSRQCRNLFLSGSSFSSSESGSVSTNVLGSAGFEFSV